jgi:L-threonylcarbamoyladenylate synthase
MSESDSVERAVAALEAGDLVVLPTDTVYGLAATAYSEEAARRLYRLKGRDEIRPTAIVVAGVDALLECVPELRGRADAIARTLLPGPYTLVLPNPARRFGWLAGSRPDTIGVRVPLLSGPVGDVLERVGAVVATSANLVGGPDPRRLADVPAEILAGVAAFLDGGELPGVPSTVIDFTGAEPVVLRRGAADEADALARVAAHRILTRQ